MHGGYGNALPKGAPLLFGTIITRREKNVKYLLFMANYAFGE